MAVLDICDCNKKGEEFIFTMNAAKPVKKDQECAEAIRRCLSKEREGKKGVKVPLRWYALYQKLLQVVEGLGKKVLSREQCGLVAESMEIDEESCEEALQFFNRLNMLFYFPDTLPNLVFMDPQMLLDKVTELVEESYRMSQEKKDQPLCPIRREDEEMKFRDYGQVTEKFLSKFDSHYEKPLFTHKELITLLRGLLVFADLSEDVYFMPCLLQVKTPQVVAQYQVSGKQALTLHFPDSGPLLGMFCSTVAYLLSSENAHPCPWQVVQDEAGTPECLNRNVIQFTIPKVMGTVSLIDHFTHFEIHIHTLPKKAVQLWKVAHDAVFAGLKKAGKTLGYTNNTPVPAIVCPAHPTTPHPATVEEGGWNCSKMAHIFGSIAEDTIPWWSVCSTHSECMYAHMLCGLGCALIGVDCASCFYVCACLFIVLFVFSPLSIAVVPCDSTQSSTAPQPHPPTLPGELCLHVLLLLALFLCLCLYSCVCYLFILPSLPYPLPSTAIIASSTSLPCTSSSISVSTTPAGESCGGWYAVYTVSVHVLVASVSVQIYIPFKCNLLSFLSTSPIPPQLQLHHLLIPSPFHLSLQSLSLPLHLVSSGLCTLTICKLYTVRNILCTNLVND